MTFQYDEIESNRFPGTYFYRPTIPVEIGTKGRIAAQEVTFGYARKAIADTGSDLSIFPISLGEQLRIELEPGEEIVTATGSFQTFMGKVILRISDDRLRYTWGAKVAFAAGNRAVLGMDGFFEHFHVSFNGWRRELSVHKRKSDQRVKTYKI